MSDTNQKQRLEEALTHGFSLAADGRTLLGYRALTECMAEAMGAPGWSAELRELWCAVIEEYQRRYPADWYPERE